MPELSKPSLKQYARARQLFKLSEPALRILALPALKHNAPASIITFGRLSKITPTTPRGVLTLLMTNPFFVTIFAFLFLKEKVGIRRWTAVVIGFIGVVVVINPQNLEFNYIFILPIISAIFLTIRDIATKTLATQSNNVEITFITALLITIFAGLASIYFGYHVTLDETPHILISSVFVLFGYLFSVMTVYYAPLSLTASARYSVIIFGIIFGYFILNEVPSSNMIIGAIIITLSGLFVIKRERDIGKIN